MKGKLIKKIALFMALVSMVGIFSACSNNPASTSNEATKDESSIKYASYWTQQQKDTVDSLKQIDKDGYFYEMTYAADYSVDDIIAGGADTSVGVKEVFKNLYLPNSDLDVTKSIYAAGCSAFATKNDKGEQILGRNYDWIKAEEVAIAVHTSPKDGYKSVGLTDVGFIGGDKNFSTTEDYERTLFTPLLTTDGINEKGLACTVLILEEDGTKQENGNKKLVESLAVRVMLDKAATVKEAEELLRQYDCFSDFYKSKDEDPLGGTDFHWMVTDKSGDAAIFEFVDNKLVVNKEPVKVETDIEALGAMSTEDINKNVKISYPKEETGYSLLTNFYVTEGYVNTNGEGYWRYNVLSEDLQNNPNPSNDEAMKYLKDVKYFMNDKDYIADVLSNNLDPEDEKNWKWLTVWSEVYDTETLSLDICIREDYENVYKLTVE